MRASARLTFVVCLLIYGLTSLGDINSKFISRDRSWDTSKLPVGLKYNPSNHPPNCPDSTTIRNRVSYATGLWSNSYSFFTVSAASPFTTGDGLNYDETNVIVWGSNENARVYAETFLNPENTTGPGVIIGADIKLSTDGGSQWSWWFNSGPPDTRNENDIDFVETIMHEVGHVAGLADVNWNYSIMRSDYALRTIPFRAIEDGSKAGWVYQHTKDELTLSGQLWHSLDISYLPDRVINLAGNVTIPSGMTFRLEENKATVNLGTYSIYTTGGSIEDAGGNTWAPADIKVTSGGSLLGHFPSISAALTFAQSGQTVIVGAGAYTMSSSMAIPSGVTLQFASGSTINVNGNHNIHVDGTLLAEGTTFTNPSGQWRGIEMYGASSNSHISGCTIQNAQCGVHVYATNYFYIDHCTIENCDTAITSNSSSHTISCNYITGNTYGVACIDYSQADFQLNNWVKFNSRGIKIDGTSTPYLSGVYCSIWGNDWDVWSDYGGTISAQYNYWGSYPANPMIYGNVDYSNELMSEPSMGKIAPDKIVRPTSMASDGVPTTNADTTGMAELDQIRALEMQSTVVDAQTTYGSLIARYPDKPAGFVALAHLSQLTEKSGADAIQPLSAYASIYETSALGDFAKVLAGQVLIRKGDTEGALSLFEPLAVAPTSRFERDALYNVGCLLWYRKNAKGEGEKYFRQLIQKYPNDQLTLSALAALGETYPNKQKTLTERRTRNGMRNG